MVAIIMAVGVTVGVFSGLTVFLLVAERFLVSYGPCEIDVNKGEEVLQVQGGTTLLNLLRENGYNIPSACGGKGSCGYCRVVIFSGGGPVLPTEAPLLTRTEIRGNVRLACQVKVKQDMAIAIPDFLETVRSMVKNQTFDPGLRWHWLTSPEAADEPLVPAVVHVSHEEHALVEQILLKHEGQKGSIVPILQEVNNTYNYLPEAVLRLLATGLDRPLSELHRVATFYNAFSLVPRGRNIIKVCMGTACYVKRGEKILETVERKLGIQVDQCTPDGRFSIETVSCIGCCGQAPSLVINDEIYGYLRNDMVEGILDKFE